MGIILYDARYNRRTPTTYEKLQEITEKKIGVLRAYKLNTSVMC